MIGLAELKKNPSLMITSTIVFLYCWPTILLRVLVHDLSLKYWIDSVLLTLQQADLRSQQQSSRSLFEEAASRRRLGSPTFNAQWQSKRQEYSSQQRATCC